MSALLLMGLITGIAALFTFAKLGMRKMAGYAFIIDVVFTIFFIIWFGGTISGLIVGTMAGLFVSVFFYLYVKLFGYDRYSFKHGKWISKLGIFNTNKPDYVEPCEWYKAQRNKNDQA